MQTIFALRTATTLAKFYRSNNVTPTCQTTSGRSVGGIGTGRVVDPVRKRSTPAAAARPSAIAHTISDWPRPASPATKTPGTEDMYDLSRATLPRGSRSTPS